MNLNCQGCHADVELAARFCGNCGLEHPLATVAPTQASTPILDAINLATDGRATWSMSPNADTQATEYRFSCLRCGTTRTMSVDPDHSSIAISTADLLADFDHPERHNSMCLGLKPTLPVERHLHDRVDGLDKRITSMDSKFDDAMSKLQKILDKIGG